MLAVSNVRSGENTTAIELSLDPTKSPKPVELAGAVRPAKVGQVSANLDSNLQYTRSKRLILGMSRDNPEGINQRLTGFIRVDNSVHP